MKKFLVFLAAILLVFGVVGIANALPYLDVNGDHSSGVWMGTFNQTETWHFDLDNDTLDLGDINPGDSINTANLAIEICDNDPKDNRWWKLEYADITLDGYLPTIFNNIEVDPGILSFDVYTFVSVDHYLTVVIDTVRPIDCLPLTGNFWVNEVSIGGDYEPVPEPATMLLLGSGLIGLAGLGRKKFFKKS